MGRPGRGSSTNVVTLVLLLLGVIALGYYATVALTSRDPLWFLNRFEDRPERLVLYDKGQRHELRPGDRGFDELAEAVRASLAGGFARLSAVGFSAETLHDAYSQQRTLEVFWGQPVELHAWFPTGRTTQMLFPLTGRHAELSIVLLGDGGEYRAGAPVLETMEPIRDALRAMGYE